MTTPKIAKKIDAATVDAVVSKSLIKRALTIKRSILELNAKLQADKQLSYEYHLLMKGKLVADLNEVPAGCHEPRYEPSPQFLAFIKEYEKVAKAYAELKVNVISNEFVKAQEIEQIEKLAAGNKKNTQVDYYPYYHEKFEFEKKKIQNSTLTIIENVTQEFKDIDKAYKQRSKFWDTWNSKTLKISLIGIGIPFFVGGLVIQALDFMITSIRKNMCKNEVIDAKESAEKQILNTHFDIKRSISSNSFSRFNQGFFNLSKVFHAERVEEVVSKSESLFQTKPSLI